MTDVQCDPNVIYGPVCPAHVWKGSPGNLVRNGWGFEVYTRLDGKVGSSIPRVHRSRPAAVRARREMLKSVRAYNEAYCAARNTIHDCPTDAKLLVTIRRVWG